MHLALSVLVWGFIFFVQSVQATEETIPTGQPNKFHGVLNAVTFQIDPAQNDPVWAKDGKYEAYVLVSSGLQTFKGLDPASGNKDQTVSLQMIQLITKSPEKLKAKVGQVIELEATPEWASSRYHRTPVLFIETKEPR